MDKSDLRYFIVDDIIPKDILLECESKCPSSILFLEDEDVVETTTQPVGDFGKEWNIPSDESYQKQGVIVKRDNPPNYFTSEFWLKIVADIVGIDYKKLIPNLWNYRTNIENTDGLWLHTDKDLYEDDLSRNIEVLIYANNKDWKKEYGGQLLLFSNENKIDNVDRKCFNEWQHSRRLNELNDYEVGDTIRTKGVGGGWNKQDKLVDFKLEEKISPVFGRVVILDYRNNYNVHAVTPKNTYNRKSLEQWFNYE